MWTVSSGVQVEGPASLAVSDGMVFVDSSLQTLFAVSVNGKGKVWKSTAVQFDPNDFAVAYHLAYVGTPPQGPHGQGPSVFAIDDKTGAVKWSFTTNFDGLDPEVAGGVVYVSNNGGTFFALDALTGQKLWSAPGAGSYPGYPAIINGRVYLNNHAFGLK